MIKMSTKRYKVTKKKTERKKKNESSLTLAEKVFRRQPTEDTIEFIRHDADLLRDLVDVDARISMTSDDVGHLGLEHNGETVTGGIAGFLTVW
jgi:hypothetical protein